MWSKEGRRCQTLTSYSISGEAPNVEVYTNYDITNVKTPIDVGALKKLLEDTGYNKDKTEYLINGFRNGFRIGYHGPKDRQDTAKNLRLRVGSKHELWQKVMKEVKLEKICWAIQTDSIC